MIVLLDSNVFISALISPHGVPGNIYSAWLQGRFRVVTCQQQIDEIRLACRTAKFKSRLQPHHVGTMLNYLYAAIVWQGPLPRKHQAADPADSYLLDLMEAAQPDYAVTGDKRSGLLELGKLGRTKILSATAFSSFVLHLQ
jgi:putative PIN family toxin of toxin-antitoxin system